MVAVVKEIASSVNDSRPKLLALLQDQTITRLVLEHKDRLTRFGFRYLEVLMQGRRAFYALCRCLSPRSYLLR